MNIYNLGSDVFRFQLWNLLGPIDGHITVYWHRASGHWLFRKSGDFGNLISYLPRNDSPDAPTEEQRAFLQERIDDALKGASFWTFGLSHTKWPFLRDEDRAREHLDGYVSRCGATVFDEDYSAEMHAEPHDKQAVATLSLLASQNVFP